jgi:hypothetical protein
MRWVRTKVNHREPNSTNDQHKHDRRGDQDRRGCVDERQLIVSVLSDHSPIQNHDIPFQTAVEISKRKRFPHFWHPKVRISKPSRGWGERRIKTALPPHSLQRSGLMYF